MNINSSDGAATPLSHAAIYTALTNVVPAASIAKYRISSVVLDPPAINSSGLQGVLFGVDLGISGNHFQYSQLNRPLRIRFGKDYGDDGMWIVTNGATLSKSSLPGTEDTTDAFITVDPAGAVGAQVNAHFRIAWTDPT